MQDNVRHWLISNTRIIKTSIITLHDDCTKLRKCYFWIVVIDIFSNSKFSVKINQYKLQYIWCVNNISLLRVAFSVINIIIRNIMIPVSVLMKWCCWSFVYILRQCICGLRLLHILVSLNIHLHGFGHLMLYIYNYTCTYLSL